MIAVTGNELWLLLALAFAAFMMTIIVLDAIGYPLPIGEWVRRVRSLAGRWSALIGKTATND